MTLARLKLGRIWALFAAAWIVTWAGPNYFALGDWFAAQRRLLIARQDAQIAAADRSRNPLLRAEDHALKNYLAARGPATFSLTVAERDVTLRRQRLVSRMAWLVGGPLFAAAIAIAASILIRRHRFAHGPSGERD